MPMEIFGEVSEPYLKVFNSPVIELICAVHLLTDAAHHQYEIMWAEEVLSKLTEEEKSALDTLRVFPAGGMNIMNFILESGELESIARFIEYIEQIDILDFYYFLLNEEIERARIQKAFTDKKERYKIQEKIKWIVEDHELMEFFEHPQRIKSNTVKVYKTILNNDFLLKLEKCRNKMEEGIQYVNSFIGKDAIDTSLEKIIGRPKKLFSGYREYYIIPSYFVSPQRCIRVFSGDRIYVVFDCRVTRDKREALLEELSTILKVIDDKSRMEILRILVNSKSYGKAISDQVGISTPTVSHHLDILKQAGFIKEEKIRNIKYFYADKQMLKQVIDKINKYFFGAD